MKVFVEMMSIAAGEYDYEVDRVACFEASCLAFSPMIFELEIESGFTELYSACEKTAESLNEDPKIIDKLVCLIFNFSFLPYATTFFMFTLDIVSLEMTVYILFFANLQRSHIKLDLPKRMNAITLLNAVIFICINVLFE